MSGPRVSDENARALVANPTLEEATAAEIVYAQLAADLLDARSEIERLRVVVEQEREHIAKLRTVLVMVGSGSRERWEWLLAKAKEPPTGAAGFTLEELRERLGIPPDAALDALGKP
jgi:hypothetical protein